MTAKQRKQRSDSVSAEVRLAAGASSAISVQWPAEISLPRDDHDRSVALRAYSRVLAGRPQEYWRPADYLLAADLAVCVSSRDKLQAQIDLEGPTVMGGKNGTTPVKHPAMQALEHYRGAVIQLSRALGMTGAQGAEAHPHTIAAEARRQNAAGFTYEVEDGASGESNSAGGEVIDYSKLKM